MIFGAFSIHDEWKPLTVGHNFEFMLFPTHLQHFQVYEIVLNGSYRLVRDYFNESLVLQITDSPPLQNGQSTVDILMAPWLFSYHVCLHIGRETKQIIETTGIMSHLLLEADTAQNKLLFEICQSYKEGLPLSTLFQ